MCILSHANFSSEVVAKGLSTSSGVCSGKVVKWLIRNFQLDSQHIKANRNHLLAMLLLWGKVKCAEWLIHKFNVTLDEIPQAARQITRDPQRDFPLRAWKMLLHVFPKITAAFVKKHLMKLAIISPLHVRATIKAVPGLTFANMVDNPAEMGGSCTDA
ncbi:hypothetical protein Pelo_13618 [Pelomyxa schiedti]|nr:hypothetical protein Pelo_13618 [Pelomyxa schiedti]